MINQPHKGFTLIEMLIAMTLLGVMVVLLFSSLKIAANSWNVGEDKVVAVNKKAVVYQFFRQHLTSILPVVQTTQPELLGDATPQPSFIGQAQAMRFVGALPVSSARKGLQIFQIAANTDDASKLMVALSPFIGGDNAQADKEVLVDHVKSYKFAYFGNIDQIGPGGWMNEWSADKLPKLIKVSILLDDDSYWPDMVFQLKIDGQIGNSQLHSIGNPD
ncbi:prepilin-type N-terminal cleavage/methylation domain-containing protein [Methylomonas sp. AM2-LC]|uniref:prepilin-type N-terminal cleavage/methylation domain-containing protein n=1 Tax=Methylomonas sp. AM2-LC TaxID=3153301 RepID=UPI003267273E